MHAALWDIGPTISGTLPAWPGDARFEVSAVRKTSPGCPAHVSRMTKSTSTAAAALDAQTSKTPDAHRAVRAHHMAIFDGAVRDTVATGNDALIDPPLEPAGMDAGLVRTLPRPLALPASGQSA